MHSGRCMRLSTEVMQNCTALIIFIVIISHYIFMWATSLCREKQTNVCDKHQVKTSTYCVFTVGRKTCSFNIQHTVIMEEKYLEMILFTHPSEDCWTQTVKDNSVLTLSTPVTSASF